MQYKVHIFFHYKFILDFRLSFYPKQHTLQFTRYTFTFLQKK